MTCPFGHLITLIGDLDLDYRIDDLLLITSELSSLEPDFILCNNWMQLYDWKMLRTSSLFLDLIVWGLTSLPSRLSLSDLTNSSSSIVYLSCLALRKSAVCLMILWFAYLRILISSSLSFIMFMSYSTSSDLQLGMWFLASSKFIEVLQLGFGQMKIKL